MRLIHNVLIPGQTQHTTHVLIDGGQISVVGGDLPALDVERIDGQGGYLLPGFIDMHVHGSAGADTMDATPDALHTMARFFASRGVTGWLATTMTHTGEAITRALENAADCRGAFPDGATLLGVHLEGPYINIEAKGAQAGEHVRAADPREYAPWLDLGVIREVTVASEFPENMAFIRECVRRGIVVSLGHTTAGYEQAAEAFVAGATQVTHTFNAMTGLHHRAPGMVGAALTADQVRCELITDTIHVHPAAINVVVRAKGAAGTILITDAIRAAGLGDCMSELGGQQVTVRDGKATLGDGTLAGSVLTMDTALKNTLRAAGLESAQAMPDWQALTSQNAAQQLGLGHRKGAIKAGYDADLVLLDRTLVVQMTIAAGRPVYRREGF
jgi:N-acetylglucosamine-6-phosphate deacetylase